MNSRSNSKKSVSKSKSKTCPKGQIMRSGYTTKSGTVVKRACIPATSASGKKTSVELKKYLKKKDAMHQRARQKFPKESLSRCKSGEIMREGYFVKSHSSRTNSKTGKTTNVKGHWVAPKCIKSQLNRSSKGPRNIVLMEKDILKPFGYENIESMSNVTRHGALKKAIRTIKPLSVYRRLIAVATLNKNKNEKLYNILRQDAEWIKTQTEYLREKSSNIKKSSKAKTLSKTKSKINSKQVSKKKTTSKK